MIADVNRRLLWTTAEVLAVAAVAVATLSGCAGTGVDAEGAPERPWASAGPPSVGPSVSPSSAPPTCPPSGVRMQVGEPDAALGLRAVGIDLINCGSHTYRLDGYPQVRVLNDHETTISVRV